MDRLGHVIFGFDCQAVKLVSGTKVVSAKRGEKERRKRGEAGLTSYMLRLTTYFHNTRDYSSGIYIVRLKL